MRILSWEEWQGAGVEARVYRDVILIKHKDTKSQSNLQAEKDTKFLAESFVSSIME